MAFWSDLHEDILFLILSKITNFSDSIRFSCVCSSWRRTATKQQQESLHEGFPGFITGKRKNISFLPISRINLHCDILPSLPSLSPPKKGRCLGSYRGWLVMEDSKSNLTAINPVSKVQFSLPRLNTSIRKSFIRRVVFSSSPSNPNVFIFLFHGRALALAYCRRGDGNWTDIRTVIPSETNSYIDAIYFKGQLYAFHSSGKLLVCDLMASPPKMTGLIDQIPRQLSMLPGDYCPTCKFAASRFVLRFWLASGQLISFERCLLVESGGELLLVYCQKNFNLNTGNCKATKFEVYKFNTYIERWDPVTSLGGYALFLGLSQPFALSEFKVRGIKGSHIYYAEDFNDHCNLGTCRPCDRDNDMVVYSLENSNLEFIRSPFPPAKPYGMWFTPCLGGR